MHTLWHLERRSSFVMLNYSKKIEVWTLSTVFRDLSINFKSRFTISAIAKMTTRSSQANPSILSNNGILLLRQRLNRFSLKVASCWHLRMAFRGLLCSQNRTVGPSLSSRQTPISSSQEPASEFPRCVEYTSFSTSLHELSTAAALDNNCKSIRSSQFGMKKHYVLESGSSIIVLYMFIREVVDDSIDIGTVPYVHITTHIVEVFLTWGYAAISSSERLTHGIQVTAIRWQSTQSLSQGAKHFLLSFAWDVLIQILSSRGSSCVTAII